MILLPAIDIRDGRAVRLRQGDFDQETVYADTPLEAARAWADAGARELHVVDLDGAREGTPRSLGHLRSIRAELGLPVQYGGGLRSLEAAHAALDAGADRVVLGTAALRDQAFLGRALAEWPDRVMVAIDVRGGRVSVSGWAEEEDIGPVELIERLGPRGARRFVYTSVDRDGMLEGPDPEEVRRVGAVVEGAFVYSGGIGSLADLRLLRDLGVANLSGVISGKALYERRFTVGEGQAALGEAVDS